MFHINLLYFWLFIFIEFLTPGWGLIRVCVPVDLFPIAIIVDYFNSLDSVIVSPSLSLSFINSHPYSLMLLLVRTCPFWSLSCKLANKLFIVKFLFMLSSVFPCSLYTIILYFSSSWLMYLLVSPFLLLSLSFSSRYLSIISVYLLYSSIVFIILVCF